MKIVHFTPSVTAYGGDSSLLEGAFGALFKFVYTLRFEKALKGPDTDKAPQGAPKRFADRISFTGSPLNGYDLGVILLL